MAPLGAPIAQRAVAGEAAFDLTSLPDGAALVTGDRGGGVSLTLLDHAGGQRDQPLSLSGSQDGSVVEVAAASDGSRLALAWTLRLKTGPRASSFVLGDAATRSFSAPLSLGETSADGEQTGAIAVTATEDGGFVALRRGLDEPCSEDPSRHCVGYAFRELSATAVESRGLPMAVPVPCARIIAGLVVAEGRWHYGFCSQAEGRPVTTHFMRQLAPFFVEVHRSFEGCTPVGATVVAGDALFAADCPDGRRGVRVGAMGVKLRSLRLWQSEVICERGSPVIKIPGDAPVEIVLKEPRAGLSVLLPPRLAPGNTKAVWTGTTLLSAAWVAGEVAVRRYECSGSELVAR
ncbi:MAG TPA: hypothetical protein VGP93_07780 [Polyangiaceae bacterium]|nr:hypothetical protein [Polyangiaceae bacterium]